MISLHVGIRIGIKFLPCTRSFFRPVYFWQTILCALPIVPQRISEFSKVVFTWCQKHTIYYSLVRFQPCSVWHIYVDLLAIRKCAGNSLISSYSISVTSQWKLLWQSISSGGIQPCNMREEIKITFLSMAPKTGKERSDRSGNTTNRKRKQFWIGIDIQMLFWVLLRSEIGRFEKSWCSKQESIWVPVLSTNFFQIDLSPSSGGLRTKFGYRFRFRIACAFDWWYFQSDPSTPSRFLEPLIEKLFYFLAHVTCLWKSKPHLVKCSDVLILVCSEWS